MRDLLNLFGRAKQAHWVWREREMEAFLLSLGASLREVVPGRKTYAILDGKSASVYMEGHDVEFVEMTLDAFFGPHRLSPDEYEEKVDEYFAKYEAAVGAAQGLLGPPAFNDGAASAGFPDDQDAVWLALWNLPNARFMIQQKHEDKELPIRLCIVVAPPAPAPAPAPES